MLGCPDGSVCVFYSNRGCLHHGGCYYKDPAYQEAAALAHEARVEAHKREEEERKMKRRKDEECDTYPTYNRNNHYTIKPSTLDNFLA